MIHPDTGPLTATGTVVKAGSRVGFGEAVAADAGGNAVATASSTMLIFDLSTWHVAFRPLTQDTIVIVVRAGFNGLATPVAPAAARTRRRRHRRACWGATVRWRGLGGGRTQRPRAMCGVTRYCRTTAPRSSPDNPPPLGHPTTARLHASHNPGA